jgi:hypothetical protein
MQASMHQTSLPEAARAFANTLASAPVMTSFHNPEGCASINSAAHEKRTVHRQLSVTVWLNTT